MTEQLALTAAYRNGYVDGYRGAVETIGDADARQSLADVYDGLLRYVETELAAWKEASGESASVGS